MTTRDVHTNGSTAVAFEEHFELDDNTDAQWFAWGVFDGFTGSRSRDGGPELDSRESAAAFEARKHSYQVGKIAGRAMRVARLVGLPEVLS